MRASSFRDGSRARMLALPLYSCRSYIKESQVGKGQADSVLMTG